MHVFKQSLKVFSILFNFKNYRHSEIIIKSLLLIIMTPVITLLWGFTWLFYLIERLVSPLFKKLLALLMRLFSMRAYQKGAKSFGLTLLFLLLLVISLPIIFLYYLSMLSKILLKSIIKNLLLKLDFSIQYSNDSILIFDDALSGKVSFNTIFKDASQTEAFGKMLEDLINNAPENPFLNDNEDDEKTN